MKLDTQLTITILSRTCRIKSVQAHTRVSHQPKMRSYATLEAADELVLLCKNSAPLKQVEDDRQSDQTDKTIFAQVSDQHREIAHNSAKERDRVAEQDARDDPQSDQQQEDLRYLTKPLLYFFQVMHLRLS